jgi:predicted nucleic acid-binding protein
LAKVLLDTDVLIDHLTDQKKSLSGDLTDAAYSSVTRAELYSAPAADEQVIDRLLIQFEEISVDRLIAEEAGRIRRLSKVKLPDALIAATAIVSKRRLLTRNVRDFKKIDRLKLHTG